MKKLLAGFLSVMYLMLAVIMVEPAIVSADTNEYKTWNGKCLSYFEQGNFRCFVKKERDTRKKINGEVWIEAAYNKKLTGKITIPKEIKRKSSDTVGYDIVGICSRGFSYKEISSITIGANVKEIGGSAFRCCEKLTKVSLPSGLLYLRAEAFDQCKSLKEISIPNKVKTIEVATFRECKSLTKVTMKKSVTKIEDSAFYGCYALKKVTLSKQLKSLGSSVFNGCRALESITLPSTLKSIGDYCFEECESLKKITVPNGITKISKSMFFQCLSLKKAVLSDDVTDIGDNAFSSCKSLTDINIPKKLQNIGASAFSGIAISKIDFPDTLKTIGSHAFGVCTKLREAIIPEGVTKIGEYAFGECSSLYKISVPSTVKVIPNSMCYLDPLTELKLAEGIEEIGETAFAHTKLDNISIPKSVKKFESTSFCGTPFMENIYLSCFDTDNYKDYYIINGHLLGINKFVYNGGDLFIDGKIFLADKNGYIQKTRFDIPSGVKRVLCSIGDGYTEEVKLPSGVEYISDTITGCFKELELPSSLKYVRGITSGNLKSLKLPENLEVMPDLTNCSSLESITIPSKITAINGEPYGGFSSCTSLKKIVIKGKITEIASGAFAGTALTSFDIPDTVKTIGNIYQGTTMDSVVIPAGITQIEWIWDTGIKSMKIKEGCKNVQMHFDHCTSLKEVKLPDTLEQITDMAFEGCTSLTEIKLPTNLYGIGNSAFRDTGITDVKIPKGCGYIGTNAFNSGTTVRIHKDSKLLNDVDEYKNSGYKVVIYK